VQCHAWTERARYYTARIAVDEGELERLPDLTLTSGMPVETFIQTGERTALSYLTKPLADQIMRSFRSD
jgi:HlyD family secretion protein